MNICLRSYQRLKNAQINERTGEILELVIIIINLQNQK